MSTQIQQLVTNNGCNTFYFLLCSQHLQTSAIKQTVSAASIR